MNVSNTGWILFSQLKMYSSNKISSASLSSPQFAHFQWQRANSIVESKFYLLNKAFVAEEDPIFVFCCVFQNEAYLERFMHAWALIFKQRHFILPSFFCKFSNICLLKSITPRLQHTIVLPNERIRLEMQLLQTNIWNEFSLLLTEDFSEKFPFSVIISEICGMWI